jgi:hypothetical protein
MSPAIEPRPQCCVPGCGNVPAGEIHYELPKRLKKPASWPHIFVCAEHMYDPDLNLRLNWPKWQRVLQFT